MSIVAMPPASLDEASALRSLRGGVSQNVGKATLHPATAWPDRTRNPVGAALIAVIVLDRILLTLIVAELVYTLRFVLRTHEIVVEPFLYIGLIAVVRRILIVTAGFERTSLSGRALTNLLLELGLLGLLVPALAAAIFLVRRADRHHAVVV